MIDLRPDVSTYARVSYAQELQGAIPAAIRSMEAAYQAAGSPADAAWASYYLGELYWNRGDVAGAEASYRRGTRIDPSFVPNDQGLAKVAAARGRHGGGPEGLRERGGALPAPAVRAGVRGPRRGGGEAAARRAAVRALPRRGQALRRERRRHGPGDGAVRRGPRGRRGGWARGGAQGVAAATAASPSPTRWRGSCSRTVGRARRSATRSGRSRSGRRTPASSSTAA